MILELTRGRVLTLDEAQRELMAAAAGIHLDLGEPVDRVWIDAFGRLCAQPCLAFA